VAQADAFGRYIHQEKPHADQEKPHADEADLDARGDFTFEALERLLERFLEEGKGT
jgi:hypothetical protein